MGRPLTYTDKQVEQIKSLALANVPVIEIAKKINRNPKGIYCLLTRLGIPRQPRNKFKHKSENPSWNGGRYIDKDGYVMILAANHPNSTLGGYVREHRLVMEKNIGRLLTASEVVHHIDGDKQNNKIENLQLFAKNADHLKHELTGRVPNWTDEGKKRIAKGVKKSLELRRLK